MPKFAIKYSPLHLIYFYPSVQIGVEQRILPNTTLQYEGGWVFNNSNDNRNYGDKRGYRLLAELRYYLPFTVRVPFYIALEGDYQNIAFNRNRVIQYDENAPQQSYYQYIEYKVKTEQKGAGFRIGMLVYPGGIDSHFFFDINGGLSVYEVVYKNVNLPPGNYTLYEEGIDDIFAPDETSRRKVGPMIGIRLGYRLK